MSAMPAPAAIPGAVRLSIEVADDRAAPAIIAEAAKELAARLGNPNPNDEPEAIAREAMGLRERDQARRLLMDALLATMCGSEEERVLGHLRDLMWAGAFDYEARAEIWERVREEADQRAANYWRRSEEAEA